MTSSSYLVNSRRQPDKNCCEVVRRLISSACRRAAIIFGQGSFLCRTTASVPISKVVFFMSALSAVNVWVVQLRDGDPGAAQQLWNTYFLRMVKVARCKLHGSNVRVADEEDVALSAFKSFCRGTRDGRFPQLQQHDDPWPLLLALTTHKAIDLLRYERRIKRGGSGQQCVPLDAQAKAAVASIGLSQLIGKEPDPQATFQIAEECQDMLDRFSDTILRAIALWKMEGFTTEEIAAKLDCTTRTVERKLKIIRRQWERGDPLR
jgi:DNA-directed RNA polymerase specialized sigma24 family protein